MPDPGAGTFLKRIFPHNPTCAHNNYFVARVFPLHLGFLPVLLSSQLFHSHGSRNICDGLDMRLARSIVCATDPSFKRSDKIK